MQCIGLTISGIEDIAKQEIKSFGTTNISLLRGAVLFTIAPSKLVSLLHQTQSLSRVLLHGFNAPINSLNELPSLLDSHGDFTAWFADAQTFKVKCQRTGTH